MIKINKNKLTIDIDTGSQEVRDNIIENTGFNYLDKENYVLAYNTKTSIVFCTKKELLDSIELIINEADQEELSNQEFAEFATTFDETLATDFLNYLDIHENDKYFQSMADFVYETIYDRYSAKCNYCDEEKGNFETKLVTGEVVCNDCITKARFDKDNIPTLVFKNLLDQADAISIDDSPMLTNWKLGDDESLIDTKWNEDDLEYDCVVEDISKIKFLSDSCFHIYHEVNRVTRVKLFSIKTIGVE